MIIQAFCTKIEDMNVDGMWFQLLHQSFPGRVFSHFSDHNWSPRSCDLRPLDCLRFFEV